MNQLSSLASPTGRPQLLGAGLLALAMAVVVGAALAFEHIGGYIPCALCLEQRTPYYLGVPLMIAAAVSAALKGPAILTRGLLAVGGLLMLYGAGLGVYHSGVEWGFWEGPTSCATSAPGVTTNALDLLGDINAKKPPSCDAAALRVLGLSFAGWNVVASVVLAVIAFRASRARA